MIFTTHEQFSDIISNQKYGTNEPQDRWEYMQIAAQLIRDLKAQSVLEVGTENLVVCQDSDTMGLKSEKIKQNLESTPWPIANKKYDVFVALQVWEHLHDKQVAAFDEAARVAKNVILSLPHQWKRGESSHLNIDLETITNWACGQRPSFCEITKRGVQHRIVCCWDEKSLGKFPNPEFTRNYTTDRTDNWQKWLAPFRDKAVSALEIGSLEGRSSCWFAENILTHPEARLVCVDPHSYESVPDIDSNKMTKVRNRFYKNTLQHRRAGKIQHIDSTSRKFLRYTKDKYDFIYVDGHHEPTHVLEDGLLSILSLKKDGIIIFDDYELSAPYAQPPRTPKLLINALLDIYKNRLEVLHKGWQMVVRLK